MRLSVSWRILLDGEGLKASWKGGVALFVSLSYFLIVRSDEVFSCLGVPHPVHCLTRGDVALFAGDVQLGCDRRTIADKMEVRVREQKGDQDQIGSVRVRTRDETTSPRAGYGADDRAVALLVELRCRTIRLPASAPVSSCYFGNVVRVLRGG